MMTPTMTAEEVAAELGRSRDWLYAHWQKLVTDRKLPKPLRGGDGEPLAWNRAHVYATLDRDLPQYLKPAAVAHRAAMMAAAAALSGRGIADQEIAEAIARLDRRQERITNGL